MSDPTQSDDRKTTVTTTASHDDRKTTVTAAVPQDDRKTTVTTVASQDDRVTTVTAAPPPPAPPPPRGPSNGPWDEGASILRGKYRIEARLQGGAQAIAFRGVRVIDGAPAFLKVQLNPTGRADAFAKQISLRDKILGIRHPNLLRCFDFDLEGGALCEAYEWLEGKELTKYFEGEEGFDHVRLKELVEQLAAAVHELHEATGLAHRDLKPDNIRVVESGGQRRYVIVDYGAVSQMDSGGATTVAGTRMYSPPEFYLRRVPNDNLLRTWDWWTLGRIVQEALDGVHPYDRIPALFRADLASGKFGPAQIAVETMFDMLMLERDYGVYKLRAGMVELSAKNTANERWMPLLRGLLTSNRRARWGYEHVQRFLRGETVRDSYGMSIELEGFDFEGQSWSLPDLAAALMSESAAEGEKGAARWREAQTLLYTGPLERYTDGVLRNADLTGGLRACREIVDRDLGTAVALSLISEGALPPAVRGSVVDAKYLLSFAGKEGAGLEKHLAALLSDGFQAVLARAAPNAAKELSDESDRVRALREHYRNLGGKGELDLSRTLLVAHAPAEKLIEVIERDYKPSINHTRNGDLQKLYATPDLRTLEPFDLASLYWSLKFTEKNGYVTHVAHAEALRDTARKMRAAIALRDAAKYFQWWFWPFNGSARRLFALSAILAMFAFLRSAFAFGHSLPAGNVFTPLGFNMLGAGFVFGLIYGGLRLGLGRALRRIATEFLTVPGDLSAATLIKFSKEIGGPVSYDRKLDELNREIAATPAIDTAAHLTQRVSFSTVKGLMGAQVAMLVIIALGSLGVPFLGSFFVDVREVPQQPSAPVQKGKQLRKGGK